VKVVDVFVDEARKIRVGYELDEPVHETVTDAIEACFSFR